MSSYSRSSGDITPRRRGRPPGGGLTKAQAREVLLEVAQRCFLDHGLAATTMEQIARQAGFSRAALYQHFPNRDALVIGLALRVTDRYVTEAVERFADLAEPAAIITESLVFVATEVGQDPVLSLLSARTERGTVAHLITAAPELTQRITGLYEMGLSVFGADPLRPGLTVSDAARYILSIALALLMGAVPGTDNPDQIRRYITTFVLPALLADPPPPTPVFSTERDGDP